MANPGRRHPALLRAGRDHVEAPAVRIEGHRAKAADAVDQQKRVRGRVVDGRGDLADRVLDASRCLVVRHQYRLRRACRGGHLRGGLQRPAPGRLRWPHSTSTLVTSAP